MPYVILAAGILVGLYALYRFFLSASVADIKKLARNAALGVVIAAILLAALTGRLALSMVLFLGLFPFVWPWLKVRFFDKKDGG